MTSNKAIRRSYDLNLLFLIALNSRKGDSEFRNRHVGVGSRRLLGVDLGVDIVDSRLPTFRLWNFISIPDSRLFDFEISCRLPTPDFSTLKFHIDSRLPTFRLWDFISTPDSRLFDFEMSYRLPTPDISTLKCYVHWWLLAIVIWIFIFHHVLQI